MQQIGLLMAPMRTDHCSLQTLLPVRRDSASIISALNSAVSSASSKRQKTTTLRCGKRDREKLGHEQWILSPHMPLCHRHMVVATILSSWFCLAALQHKPDQLGGAGWGGAEMRWVFVEELQAAMGIRGGVASCSGYSWRSCSPKPCLITAAMRSGDHGCPMLCVVVCAVKLQRKGLWRRLCFLGFETSVLVPVWTASVGSYIFIF